MLLHIVQHTNHLHRYQKKEDEKKVIHITSGKDGADFLVLAGEPLKQRVTARGSEEMAKTFETNPIFQRSRSLPKKKI